MGRRALLRYGLGIGAIGIVALAISLSGAFSGSGGRGVGSAGAARRLPVGTGLSVLRQRFAVLGRRHSNECGLQPESIAAQAVHGRLQGACCFPMDFDRYVSQVRGLTRYQGMSQIPADPYDIPVSQARQLIGYNRSISLTPAQQAVYKRAAKLSHEHGPCCCPCWRWTAFEGQAKYLIARRNYAATEIALVWNLEDGCGGGAGEA